MVKIKICFTGRRKINNSYSYKTDEKWLATLKPVYDFLLELNQENNLHFITGGALGTDLAIGEIIEFLKLTNYTTTSELALPNENQGSNWFGESIETLNKLKSLANKITYVNQLGNYKSTNIYQQLQKRNEYMIDEADLVIAIWDSVESGGTWNAIRYARSLNKQILIFEIK